MVQRVTVDYNPDTHLRLWPCWRAEVNLRQRIGRRSSFNLCDQVKPPLSEASTSTWENRGYLPLKKESSIERFRMAFTFTSVAGSAFSLIFSLPPRPDWACWVTGLLIKFTRWRKHFVLSQTVGKDRVWKHTIPAGRSKPTSFFFF